MGPRVVQQDNEAFSERPTPFDLDRTPKLIHRFAINLWQYCGPWCYEFCQQNSLPVPEYCNHDFFLFDCVRLNFLGFLGECMCIHFLDCSWGLSFHELCPSRVISHDPCQKIRLPLPSWAEETSRLTPFFEFCESQSAVSVPTVHRTYCNPICPWQFDTKLSSKFVEILKKVLESWNDVFHTRIGRFFFERVH